MNVVCLFFNVIIYCNYLFGQSKFSVTDNVRKVVSYPVCSPKLKQTLVFQVLQIKEDDVYYQVDSCVRGPGGVCPLLPPAGG